MFKRVPPPVVLFRIPDDHGGFLPLKKYYPFLDRGLYQHKESKKLFCAYRNYYREVTLERMPLCYKFQEIYGWFATMVIGGESYPVKYLCPHHGKM